MSPCVMSYMPRFLCHIPRIGPLCHIPRTMCPTMCPVCHAQPECHMSRTPPLTYRALNVHTHAHTCMHTHACTPTHMHAHTHAHACTRMHTHTHARTHTRAHTHTHTHPHIHTQPCPSPQYYPPPPPCSPPALQPKPQQPARGWWHLQRLRLQHCAGQHPLGLHVHLTHGRRPEQHEAVRLHLQQQPQPA